MRIIASDSGSPLIYANRAYGTPSRFDSFPVGHIAGTASSLFGSITTLLGIVMGSVIGQSYDGTMIPLTTGFFLCSVTALVVVLVTERGKMFRPSTQPAK